jgi:hypothetical protein
VSPKYARSGQHVTNGVKLIKKNHFGCLREVARERATRRYGRPVAADWQICIAFEFLKGNPADAVDRPKVERSLLQTYDLDQTAELIEACRVPDC